MKYFWHNYALPWLIAALLFSLWIGTAHAQSNQPKQTTEEYCQSIGRQIANYTQFRDLGNDRMAAYVLAYSITGADQRWFASEKTLVDAVYDDRQWILTPKRAQDLAYTACLEANSKQK